MIVELRDSVCDTSTPGAKVTFPLLFILIYIVLLAAVATRQGSTDRVEAQTWQQQVYLFFLGLRGRGHLRDLRGLMK